MGLQMRYWFMPLVLVFLIADAPNAQEPKKEPPKEMQEITEFAGKKFEQWKKELHHDDPAEREVAFRAIVMFPFRKVYTALPDILKELRKHNNPGPVDLSVRVNGVIAIGKIFQAKQFFPDPDFQDFLKLPEKDRDPKKFKEFVAKHKPDPKYVADAILIFKQSLGDNQIILKVRAVQALPYLGPDARKLIAEVGVVAKDPSSWEVRKEGLICLTILAIPEEGKLLDSNLLKIYYPRLDDSSALVRITVCNALGKLGVVMEQKEKATVLDKLTKRAEKDSDHRVRIAGHVAIMTFNQKITTPHLNSILSYIEDPDPRVRLDAIHALALAGPEGKKMLPAMVPALLSTIHDKETDVTLAGFTALVAIRANEAIPRLKKLVDDKDQPRWLSEGAADVITRLQGVDAAEKKFKDQQDKEGKDKKAEKK
jgi:HEAT repeats